MKHLSIIAAGILLACTLTGCSTADYPELPEHPIAFEMGTFIDVNDHNAQYGSIVYKGRTYLPYGTASVSASDVNKCIGYIIQDENSSSVTDLSNTDRRIYTLTEDQETNFLVDYDVNVRLMNPPMMFRAEDTNGKAIPLPDFIGSSDYPFWN